MLCYRIAEFIDSIGFVIVQGAEASLVPRATAAQEEEAIMRTLRKVAATFRRYRRHRSQPCRVTWNSEQIVCAVSLNPDDPTSENQLKEIQAVALTADLEFYVFHACTDRRSALNSDAHRFGNR